jgi:superfamily II DNA or RNA helicase
MSATQELRECQKEALTIISSRREEFDETNISMCTGSGKSVVIRDTSCLANRVILVFPSLGLVTQFYDCHRQTYIGKNLFYLATEGTLKGVARFPANLALPTYVILTTYDSVPQILATLSDDRRIDMLIADEAHHIQGPVFRTAYASKTSFIQHTIHFSATLPEGKEPHYKYPLLKGIRDGVVRDFNIELFICKNEEETGLLQMIDKLVALHNGKAKILIYTAEANTDGSSVRTFMTQYASVVRARGWWIEGINKDTKDSDRKPLLRTFESDKSPATILVSCRTLSEGIDLKNANCMLPWDPTASVIDNIQRIGRVVRLYKTAAGAVAKDQPPSTILIPVFLEEAEYAACDGNREAIHKLLEKQIGEGEKGNFRPIVSVCTALKSELAEEDSDLFNQLLNYGYTPKVRVDRDLVGCVAKQLKRPEDEVLEEVADSLAGQLDEEVLDSIREGEWVSEETGAVVTALAESQGIKLIIRDNEEEEVVGTGTKEVIVERKGEGVYTASRKKKSSDAARQRVAHRLRTSFSDGCRIMLGLEGADLNATEGLVLARLTAEVQYDEDWEKRRLEWVAMYEKLGRSPSDHSKDYKEKRARYWQGTQCANYKKKANCMTLERISILKATKGWKWEKEDTWESNRLHWASQYEKLGRFPIQKSKDNNERYAGQWQSQQRHLYKNKDHRMTPERVTALIATKGWEWEEEDTWESNRLHWASQFKKLNRCPSDGSKNTDEKRAGQWQSDQRQNYKKRVASMTSERIAILQVTKGWKWEEEDTWELKRLHWASQFEKLGKYPSKRSKDLFEKQAGIWQQVQRTNYKNKDKDMTPQRVISLQSTKGWKWKDEDKWDSQLTNWSYQFAKLRRFPSDRSKDLDEKRAQKWQSHQRSAYSEKKPTMTPERIAILNATPGWSWSSDSPPTTPFVPTPSPINEVVYPAEVVPQKKRIGLVRKRVIPTATEPVSTKESKPRPLSALEELHKAYKTRNADTYFSLMQSDPSKFEEYHTIADTYDARDPPERKPQNQIAEMLKKNNRSTYRAIDLGCGRNALRRDERVSKMSWDSVDVVAADSTVTVADMGHLPFEDETYDIAILNRSLWARNHEAVLREVWRILKEGGRAILCESFRRWQEAGENTLLVALKTIGFTILSEVGTTIDSDVEDVFQYIEVRR